MSQGRIPGKKAKFGAYLQNSDNHLSADEPGGTTKRGETLGMTLAELTILHNFRLQWSTGDPVSPGAYDLHVNPDTRTKKTSKDTDKIMKDFRDFFRPILVRISGSPDITPGDRLVLNIAAPVTTHSVKTTPIAEQCFGSPTAIGGGIIKVSVRYLHDQTRSSKAPLADAVEIAGRIDPPLTDSSVPAELAGKIRKYEIGGPDDGTTKTIFTRATFTMRCGAENSGKYLQFYARWINTKHPELAGPWTGPFSVLIG